MSWLQVRVCPTAATVSARSREREMKQGRALCNICGCICLTHGQSKKADTLPDTVLFAARTNRKKGAASVGSIALPCLIVERRTVLQHRKQQQPQQQRRLLAKATS